MLDIRTGSSRSAIARNLSIGGYELSDGTPVSFADWYMPHFPEMSLLFLTQITHPLGLPGASAQESVVKNTESIQGFGLDWFIACSYPSIVV